MAVGDESGPLRLLCVNVLLRILVDLCFACGGTEVDRLSLTIRCEFRFLLVHHHSTNWVFLQQFTSLEFRVEPSEQERVGYYCYRADCHRGPRKEGENLIDSWSQKRD